MNEAAHVAERERFETAIQVLMVHEGLSSVRASTSGYGGEKIQTTGTQFHATSDLRPYLAENSSQFCYRWDTTGQIIFQYDANADGNCAIDAHQLFP